MHFEMSTTQCQGDIETIGKRLWCIELSVQASCYLPCIARVHSALLSTSCSPLLVQAQNYMMPVGGSMTSE
jgi:hypothetical protein